MEHDLFICACRNIEHQIIFSYCDDIDIKEVYMSIHIIPDTNIFKRIWHSIKYIFGYRCMYGDFDEFIFRKEDASKLLNIARFLDPTILDK
jgi:hypothetical protein